MTIRTFIPFFMAVAVFIASVILYVGGYYLLDHFTARADELATQVNVKNQALENATRAHSAISSLTTEQGSVDQYLITKQEVVSFLESLQGVGAPLGAKVNVLSVSDQKDKTRSRIQLQLSVTGSFDAVMRTLGAIEYAPYDGVMSNVTLNTGVGDGGTTTGSAWTGLATYSVGVRSATSTKP
jgi:hypothetical protein